MLLAAVGSGCADKSPAENKAAQSSKLTINDILASSQAQQTTESVTVEYPALDYTAEVDLSTLNANMVYSTVYNMVNSPDDFKGKTVKASGTFDVFVNPNTGERFYACIIADATACCSKGLEFVWEGDHTYPGDYPKTGSLISVGGVFETYEDEGQTYCRLKNAQLAF